MNTSNLRIKAGLALVNDIIPRREVCIHIREGKIESIETTATCSSNYIGGDSLVATPQPANAHIHSADHAFPEYAHDKTLEEAVAEPTGEKHVLLSKTSEDVLLEAISDVYEYLWRTGVGLVVDFREGGGKGCLLSRKALKKVRRIGLDVVILGRPGPMWPKGCDGLGLSTVFSVNMSELKDLLGRYRPAHVHVSETLMLKKQNDFQIALSEKFDAIVHGTFLDVNEIKMLKDKNMFLILCTRSNLWHSLKIPPIKEIYENDVKIALGTDNAGLIKPNIWREAETLLMLYRLYGLKNEDIPKFILKAMFVNGYLTVYKKPRLISEGNEAHILLFDGEGSGVVRALNVYHAIVKRLDQDFLMIRVDKEKVSEMFNP